MFTCNRTATGPAGSLAVARGSASGQPSFGLRHFPLRYCGLETTHLFCTCMDLGVIISSFAMPMSKLKLEIYQKIVIFEQLNNQLFSAFKALDRLLGWI